MKNLLLAALIAICLAVLTFCVLPVGRGTRADVLPQDAALLGENSEPPAGGAVNADLSVRKWDSLDPVPPFGRLTYTIVVSNTGPGVATSTRVTDTIPEGCNYVTGSPGKKGYNPIYWEIGNLASGASRTLTFTVDLNNNAGETLNNRVSTTSTAPDPNTTNNKYTEYTDIRPTIDLSLTQSDSADPAIAGSRLTYTLLVHNAGPATATGVKVTDTLPSGVTFYAATPGSTGTSTRQWDVGNMSVGASKTITLVVTTNPGFAGTLTNRARVTGVEEEVAPGNNAEDETTLMQPSVDLRLTKSDQPDPVTPGNDVTYTLVVTNDGPSVAQGIQVTDTLPAGVTFRSATPGYTGPNPLRWTIAQLIPTASKTLTLTVRVEPTALEPLVNQASTSAAEHATVPDPVPANNSVSASTGIQYRTVMTMTKSAPASAVVGDTLIYTYTLGYDVAHSDGSPIRALSVTDDVAGAAVYVSGDDGDELLEPGEVWTWTASHIVAPDDTDPLVGSALAGGLDRDGDNTTVRASAQTDILFDTAILISKDGPAEARLGETVAYSITVRNDVAHGDGSAIGQVVVTDSIALVGAPVKTGGDSDGWLEEGETWSYAATYRPKMGDADPLENVARVMARDRDGDMLVAQASHKLKLRPSPALNITKTGPATATVGQQVVYTCTLAQDTVYGDGRPIDDLSVTDSVAGPMTLVQMSGGDNDAQLEVGETWVYTASHTIKPGDRDPLVNEATAEGQDPDKGLVTASAEHQTNIVFTAALTLDKTGPDSASFGQAVAYTITMQYDADHSDGSPISNLVVSDTLTAAPTLKSKLGGDQDNLLEPGERWVYTVTRTIENSDRDPLTNTARVRGLDRDGDAVTAQDSHTVRLPGMTLGAIGEQADPVCADSRAYYAFAVSNAGAFTLTQVVVAATLPEHTTFVGAESSPGYTVDTPRLVHWTRPNLDVGQNAAYHVALQVDAAAAGSTIELCIAAKSDQVPQVNRCASTTVIDCTSPTPTPTPSATPTRVPRVRLPIMLK